MWYLRYTEMDVEKELKVNMEVCAFLRMLQTKTGFMTLSDDPMNIHRRSDRLCHTVCRSAVSSLTGKTST